MTKLLITGAGGQLGAELSLRTGAAGVAAVGLRRAELDITDRYAIARALDEVRPTALVNCAAWTEVDAAERHRDRAFAVNATAPGLLAEECARRGVVLVHVSTDYVFGGEVGEPIPESAAAAPQSVYGASKLAGEDAVRAVSGRHVIVRTSALYGRDGPNFVLSVLRQAATGAALRVVTDQVTAPTWTGHLAPALLRLLELGASGTYHLTGSGSASWYEFAVVAVRCARSRAPVRAITTADLTSAARRPHHSVLDNGRWRALGEPPLPLWTAALRDYVDELRDRGRLPAAGATSPAAARSG